MSIKDDLLKKINESVKRKKEVAKNLTRNKTIATWVSDFFTQVEKLKKLDPSNQMTYLEVQKLTNNLMTLDPRVQVFYTFDDLPEPQVEIGWGKAYVLLNQCEPTMIWTAASAFFERAMETP